MDLFDEKTRQLEEALWRAKEYLGEMNRTGSSEARLEAEEAVEDADYRLSRHMLSDPQEDKPEPPFPH